MTAEERRLEESRNRTHHWKRWGPYLSERAWGTVREDYSADGDGLGVPAARSRALAGLPLERGRHRRRLRPPPGDLPRPGALERARSDPEGAPVRPHRHEGNHGEDVKEYYFYLDSTPTHSYMRMLYKYPQAAFPYERLVDENRRRGPRRSPSSS